MPVRDSVDGDNCRDADGIDMEKLGVLKVRDAKLEGSETLNREEGSDSDPERPVNGTEGDTEGKDPLKEGTLDNEAPDGKAIEVVGMLRVKEGIDRAVDGSEVDSAVNSEGTLGEIVDNTVDGSKRVGDDGEGITPKEEGEGRLPEINDKLVDSNEVLRGVNESDVEGRNELSEGNDMLVDGTDRLRDVGRKDVGSSGTLVEGMEPKDVGSERLVESEVSGIDGVYNDMDGKDKAVDDSGNDAPVEGKEGKRFIEVEGVNTPVEVVFGTPDG